MREEFRLISGLQIMDSLRSARRLRITALSGLRIANTGGSGPFHKRISSYCSILPFIRGSRATRACNCLGGYLVGCWLASSLLISGNSPHVKDNDAPFGSTNNACSRGRMKHQRTEQCAVNDDGGRVAPDLQWVVHTQLAATSAGRRSEEHTSELQSLMRISYAVFCLKKKKKP